MSDRKSVLVVDDDPSILKGLKRLLRGYGFDAVLFDSAETFQSHQNFDEALCIILDIHLNDVSGIDVRNRLRSAGVVLPVIFITGNDSRATRTAALESGCAAYLTKPFTARSLIDPIVRMVTATQ